MQMEVIIIFCLHSYSPDVLEIKAFSNFLWTTKKRVASGTNEI